MAKILIIEDDPYVRSFYTRLFKLGEYDVLIVKDGEEGLLKLKEYKPELILLDIMMPKENGLDILKKIKQNPETKKITVVMLTNFEDESSREKAKELGSDGYIIKSEADPKVLLSLVDSYLKKVN